MGKIKNLAGQIFGRLTVIERAYPIDKKGVYWLCQCECGNKKVVPTNRLTTGDTKSCGCLRKEMKTKHGQNDTRIYKIYHGILDRCCNLNYHCYKDYGGRGITICEEWINKENGFINFYNWAMINGYTDKLTIDRINVNGNYEPINCRWVTMKEQNNNKRNNHYITINGETKTSMEWSEISSVPHDTIVNRYNRGLRDDDLLKPTRRQSPMSGEKCIAKTKFNTYPVIVKGHRLGNHKTLEEAINVRNKYILDNNIIIKGINDN